MSRVKDRLLQYKKDLERQTQYKTGLPGSALDIVNTLLADLEEDEKEKGWIPVKERLPEERDWYLAVFKESDTGYQLIPRVADFMNMSDKENTTSDGWGIIDLEKPKEYIKLLKCVAWRPLPEPYKED